MTRVALVTSSFAPYVGGVEEHVRNVAEVLSARGHDVVVWTIDREGRFGTRRFHGLEVWDLPAPLPARSVRGMLGFLFRMPAAALAWRKAFRSHRPDVIHVHCFGPNGTYARVLAARTRTPMIVTAHGETLADDEGLFTNSRFAMTSLTKGLATAAAVTGCSQVTLDDLVARFGLAEGRGEVVFNGIDLDEPVGELPSGVSGRFVAAIGRVERLKGFDLLIRAFARADLPSDVHLVVGGGGPEVEALQKLAADLGVGDRVLLPGWLDRPTVGAVRAGAVVGVLPSRFEPFGIGALEIWRAGSPLIATSHGGPPEFVRDGVDGLIVDPEDSDALAAAIEQLFGDPSRARALTDAATVRVRSFTWDHTVDEYARLYGDVTGAQAEIADIDAT